MVDRGALIEDAGRPGTSAEWWTNAVRRRRTQVRDHRGSGGDQQESGYADCRESERALDIHGFLWVVG